MAIVTLLEHLRNTKKKHTILVGPVTLSRIVIDTYSISETTLWILTDQNHEIQVNIENFKVIDFDAIVSNAQSSIQMFQCFTKLSDTGKYNAYVRDKKNNCIIEFYHINSDY
ncbi:hypothetical protein GJU41_22575 [Bacillus idriensis]|uniref:Uncharacterized protein n=1 Tax=Metabacillus idriensis TaxID=324768 RepID=A0A6I2MHX0_9BACI|nr:hypothetical protein [Metabacillus idriensis]MRX56732.1 hypothetical protein [Metabacillus idriensis]